MAWGDSKAGNGELDLPVGRIPARSREQVALVVKKIIDFQSQPPTAADLQLPVWLGSPNTPRRSTPWRWAWACR